MRACSLHRKLAIVPGDMSDYKRLAPYHYRDEKPVAVKAVFTLKGRRAGGPLGSRPAGVIVYCAPNPRVELRTIATNGAFANLDRQTQLALINANIRTIARVIIEPRFRGIGLATRLVRETMPMMNVPIVEALGVMAQVNPFLERAGMQAFAPSTPLAHVQLVEAFSTVGIEADQLIDPDAVQKQIDALGWPASDFLETRIEQFLKSHNTRRTMAPGSERTRYVLHRLTQRPTYYIWRHPKSEAEAVCSDAVRRSLLCPYGHTTKNAIRNPHSRCHSERSRGILPEYEMHRCLSAPTCRDRAPVKISPLRFAPVEMTRRR